MRSFDWTRRILVSWAFGWLVNTTALPQTVEAVDIATAEIEMPEAIAVRGFLNAYCVDCHSSEYADGERDFESLILGRVHEDTLIGLRDAADQITLGDMPPIDADQPDSEERQRVLNQIRAVMAAIDARLESTDGQTVLRRLNRREYLATISDLFDLNVSLFDPTTAFPEDATVEHLDTVGDALVTSSFLLEQYLSSAEAIVEKVFSIDEAVKPQTWIFGDNFTQQPELRLAHQVAFKYRYLCLYDGPLSDKPEGAYGPLPGFEHGVPVDGMYEVRVLAAALHRETPYSEQVLRMELDAPFRLGVRPGNIRVGELHLKQPIQPLLGEVVLEDTQPEDSPTWVSFRIPLHAGMTPRLTFENGHSDSRGAYTRILRNKSYRELMPKSVGKFSGIVAARNAVLSHGPYPQIRIHRVEVHGPIEHNYPTTSMKAVLGPGKALDDLKQHDLRPTVKRFASRAYRRPVTDEEVRTLMRFADSRLAVGQSVADTLKDVIKMVLCSPAFLYHEPIEGSGKDVSPTALATRLSYFLTGTMPDASLRRLAINKQIIEPETLRRETRRLLASSESEAFIRGFLDSWLNLRALGDMPPDRNQFREYYARDLHTDMRDETVALMRHLIDHDLPITDLLSCDYTFLNRDLAILYGMEARVPADNRSHLLRRVIVDDDRRGGILGHASVLTVTANGIETSPIIRGVWMLENIFGTPPAAPPDDVPAIDPDVRGATSIRDLIEKHRSSPACAQCHRKIDPLGFALESFDAIGRVRRKYDNGAMIDASGMLPSGQRFEDLADLKTVLLERRELFARMLTRKLLEYGLGRRLEVTDMGSLDAITASLAPDDYPMASLIEAVTSSDLFRR